jgi:hypothetical protein
LATDQSLQHFLDQRVGLKRHVAGCDQLGVHRESVESAGASLGDRMPDRARLRLGHAALRRHVKMGEGGMDQQARSWGTPFAEQHLARALELGDTGFRFLQQALTATEAQASSLSTFEEAAIEVPVVFRVGNLGLDVGQRQRGPAHLMCSLRHRPVRASGHPAGRRQ